MRYFPENQQSCNYTKPSRDLLNGYAVWFIHFLMFLSLSNFLLCKRKFVLFFASVSLCIQRNAEKTFFLSLSYSCKKVTKEHAYFSFLLKKKSKAKEIRITLTDSKRLIRVLLIAEKHKKTDLILCFDCNVCCCFCRGWRPRQPE